MTQVEFSVAPITETDNDTNVILGQSKRFRLCAWTYPGVVTKLSFKMLTPVSMSGVMEALYIGVSSNGKNVPCAGSCKAGVVTYEARWVVVCITLWVQVGCCLYHAMGPGGLLSVSLYGSRWVVVCITLRVQVLSVSLYESRWVVVCITLWTQVGCCLYHSMGPGGLLSVSLCLCGPQVGCCLC